MTAHFASLPPKLPYSFLWKEGLLMPKSDPCSDFVKETRSRKVADLSQVKVPNTAGRPNTVSVPVPVNDLCLDWLLNPDKGTGLSERVLARLLQAELHEPEECYQRDIRIAWTICLHCMRGDAVECSPAVLAWYQIVGCHPDLFYDKVMIRRAALFGKANVITLPSPKSPKKVKPASQKEKRTA